MEEKKKRKEERESLTGKRGVVKVAGVKTSGVP